MPALLISVLWSLIWVAIFAIVVVVILWAIESIAGIALPPRIKQLIWVIFVLICLIIVLSIFAGGAPIHFPGR